MKTTKRYSKPDRANPPRGLLAGKMEYGRLVEVTGKLAWPLDDFCTPTAVVAGCSVHDKEEHANRRPPTNHSRDRK